MTTGRAISYALFLTIFSLTHAAWALDPMDHRPIADVAAALKNGGQVRIGQGTGDVIAKDVNTGEIFTARSLVMLMTNKQTNDWTIAVVHDKVVASTLLMGTSLQRLSTDAAIPALPTFDRRKAEEIKPQLKGWGPSYYPDEIARITPQGFQRMWTGQISTTTEPTFKTAMTPVFVDILVRPKDAWFDILVVDQYGTCASITFGGLFSEKP